MKAMRTLFVSAAAVGLLAIGSAAQAQDKTIKIGALFPMSGPGSYFGAQDKQGVELALEQLNKAGVNGYKFVVQYEDSSCSPLPATQAAKRLIEQFKPDVIIGEECSDATLAVMPVVEQAKVPLLNAGSSSIIVIRSARCAACSVTNATSALACSMTTSTACWRLSGGSPRRPSEGPHPGDDQPKASRNGAATSVASRRMPAAPSRAGVVSRISSLPAWP